jgi:hypothetical protein
MSGRLRALASNGQRGERSRGAPSVEIPNVREGSKTGKAQNEQLFSGVPQKADLGALMSTRPNKCGPHVGQSETLGE